LRILNHRRYRTFVTKFRRLAARRCMIDMLPSMAHRMEPPAFASYELQKARLNLAWNDCKTDRDVVARGEVVQLYQRLGHFARIVVPDPESCLQTTPGPAVEFVSRIVPGSRYHSSSSRNIHIGILFASWHKSAGSIAVRRIRLLISAAGG